MFKTYQKLNWYNQTLLKISKVIIYTNILQTDFTFYHKVNTFATVEDVQLITFVNSIELSCKLGQDGFEIMMKDLPSICKLYEL